MKKKLPLLILVIIVLCWNFVFTEKTVGLTDQAKVLQGLSMAISFKAAVGNYWDKNKTLPSNVDWNNENPGVVVDLSQTIVNSIQVGEDGPGVISVLYGARPGLESPTEIDGKKINLIPGVQDGRLIWACEGTITTNLLPKNCSNLVTLE